MPRGGVKTRLPWRLQLRPCRLSQPAYAAHYSPAISVLHAAQTLAPATAAVSTRSMLSASRTDFAPAASNIRISSWANPPSGPTSITTLASRVACASAVIIVAASARGSPNSNTTSCAQDRSASDNTIGASTRMVTDCPDCLAASPALRRHRASFPSPGDTCPRAQISGVIARTPNSAHFSIIQSARSPFGVATIIDKPLRCTGTTRRAVTRTRSVSGFTSRMVPTASPPPPSKRITESPVPRRSTFTA